MRQGEIQIHGKWYRTVALRVSLFREHHPAEDGWCIQTSILVDDGKRFVVRAEIRGKGLMLATGHCEEIRGKGKINATSALENAETGAIGRALAAFGLGGEHYASADEVRNAMSAAEQRTARNNEKKEAKRRATEERQADHHPSWAKDRPGYIRGLKERGWSYDELRAHLANDGKSAPSGWTGANRLLLLTAIDEGEFPLGPAGRQR